MRVALFKYLCNKIFVFHVTITNTAVSENRLRVKCETFSLRKSNVTLEAVYVI